MDVEKIRSSTSTRVVNSSRMKLVNEDSVVLSTAKVFGLSIELDGEVDGVYPEDR
jgi:hypothetical protein